MDMVWTLQNEMTLVYFLPSQNHPIIPPPLKKYAPPFPGLLQKLQQINKVKIFFFEIMKNVETVPVFVGEWRGEGGGICKKWYSYRLVGPCGNARWNKCALWKKIKWVVTGPLKGQHLKYTISVLSYVYFSIVERKYIDGYRTFLVCLRGILFVGDNKWVFCSLQLFKRIIQNNIEIGSYMLHVFCHLSNGLFFFERCSLITATVCAYKLNNAR